MSLRNVQCALAAVFTDPHAREQLARDEAGFARRYNLDVRDMKQLTALSPDAITAYTATLARKRRGAPTLPTPRTSHRRLQIAALVGLLLYAAWTAIGMTQALPKHTMLHAGNWTISVTLPNGWLADPKPTNFPGTLFHRTGETLAQAPDVITVQFLKRDNQSAQSDLASDIARYRAGWPHVRFGDFKIASNHGKAFGKTYYLTPTHTEAVVYLDPGPGTPCFFIVTLVSFDRPAPPEATAALQTIVGSLLYVSTTPS